MNDIGHLDTRGTLSRLGELVRAQALVEAGQVRAVAHLADLHGPLNPDEASDGLSRLVEKYGERQVQVGADGARPVAEFLALEIGPVLGLSPTAAGFLLADVLNCRDRHPLMWAAVMAGEIRFWQARQVVQEVAAAGLGLAAAQSVDAALVGSLRNLGWGRARRLLRGLIVAADPATAARREREQATSRFVRRTEPADGIATIVARVDQTDAVFFEATLNRIATILGERGGSGNVEVRRAEAFGIMATPARALALLQSAATPDASDASGGPDDAAGYPRGPEGCAGHVCGSITIDPDRLLPRATLVVHVSDEALWSGRGVARAENLGPVPVKRLRKLLGHARVTVRPVFQPGAVAPVDCYEIPAAMRAAVLVRDPHEVFPFSTRGSAGLDLDHTVAYRWDEAAPPGQTGQHNLGPFSRKVHRAKTHGRWQVRQPAPGFFAWTSPAGYHYLVGPHGTIAEPHARAA